MLRPLVAGTMIAFVLAPPVSWAKDPPQQIEVERTGHILQPKSASSSCRTDSISRNLPTG